jgi:hypothetical protein
MEKLYAIDVNQIIISKNKMTQQLEEKLEPLEKIELSPYGDDKRKIEQLLISQGIGKEKNQEYYYELNLEDNSCGHYGHVEKCIDKIETIKLIKGEQTILRYIKRIDEEQSFNSDNDCTNAAYANLSLYFEDILARKIFNLTKKKHEEYDPCKASPKWEI